MKMLLILLTCLLTSCASTKHYGTTYVESTYGQSLNGPHTNYIVYSDRAELIREFKEFYKDKRINSDMRVSCYIEREIPKGAQMWNFMGLVAADAALFRPFLVDSHFTVTIKRMESLKTSTSKKIPELKKVQIEHIRGSIKVSTRWCWKKVFKSDTEETLITSEIYY